MSDRTLPHRLSRHFFLPLGLTEAVQEVTGDAPQLPSGPLHDAAEMVPYMPVVMMFAYSSNGLSHCKEEDTPEAYLLKTIEAFLLLVRKVVYST